MVEEQGRSGLGWRTEATGVVCRALAEAVIRVLAVIRVSAIVENGISGRAAAVC